MKTFFFHIQRWCREKLQSSDTFVTPFSGEFDDFAAIAHTDHLIMTQGTFGWWAAWFIEERAKHEAPSSGRINPDVLFYKYPYWENTKLYRTYVREHVYPEHWKAYTNSSIDTQQGGLLCNSTDTKLCFQ